MNLGSESPLTPQSPPTSPFPPLSPPPQPPGSSLPPPPLSPRSSPPPPLTPPLPPPPSPNHWPPSRTPPRPSPNCWPPPRTPSHTTAKLLPQNNDRKKESQSKSGPGKASPASKENLNLGMKIGLMFVGIVSIMQVGVVVLLLIKRRQLLKNNGRY